MSKKLTLGLILALLFISVIDVKSQTKAKEPEVSATVIYDFVRWLAYSYENHSNTPILVYRIFEAQSKGDIYQGFEKIQVDKAFQKKVFLNLYDFFGDYAIGIKENLQVIGMPTTSAETLTWHILKLGRERKAKLEAAQRLAPVKREVRTINPNFERKFIEEMKGKLLKDIPTKLPRVKEDQLLTFEQYMNKIAQKIGTLKIDYTLRIGNTDDELIFSASHEQGTMVLQEHVVIYRIKSETYEMVAPFEGE